MGKQITETVAGALHRRHRRARFPRFDPHLEAQVPEATRQLCNRFIRVKPGLVAAVIRQVQQLRGLHILLVAARAGDDSGAVTVQANTGAGHQKGQDQDEPAAGVNIVQTQPLEQAVPEGAELDNIILIGFVLFENGADNRSQRQRHQQGNGQIHGTKEAQPRFKPDGGGHL